MKCPKCKQDVQNIRIVYKEGNKDEGCYSCTSGSVRYWYDPTMKDYRYMHGKGLSLGYLKEVESRRVDRKTGEVYNDTGKKMFNMSTTIKR